MWTDSLSLKAGFPLMWADAVSKGLVQPYIDLGQPKSL